MRKIRPVVILFSIQLIFVFALAMINPVTNLVVRTLGTEHTFDASETLCFGDFIDDVRFCCYIKYSFDYNRFDYKYGDAERYAVINTDENGFSYISAFSHEKPESGEYLGTSKKTYAWYDNFEKSIDAGLFKKVFDANPPMFIGEKLTVHPYYKFTVKVHVYKGIAILDEMYVNGVEIEKFIKNL